MKPSFLQFGVIDTIGSDLEPAVVKMIIEESPKEGCQDKVGWTLVPVYKASEDLKRAELTAKRAVVGAGARVLFYPTLLYNVVRNKLQSEFRWWDQIEQVCSFSLLRSLRQRSMMWKGGRVKKDVLCLIHGRVVCTCLARVSLALFSRLMFSRCLSFCPRDLKCLIARI